MNILESILGFIFLIILVVIYIIKWLDDNIPREGPRGGRYRYSKSGKSKIYY